MKVYILYRYERDEAPEIIRAYESEEKARREAGYLNRKNAGHVERVEVSPEAPKEVHDYYRAFGEVELAGSAERTHFVEEVDLDSTLDSRARAARDRIASAIKRMNEAVYEMDALEESMNPREDYY